MWMEKSKRPRWWWWWGWGGDLLQTAGKQRRFKVNKKCVFLEVLSCAVLFAADLNWGEVEFLKRKKTGGVGWEGGEGGISGFSLWKQLALSDCQRLSDENRIRIFRLLCFPPPSFKLTD